MKESWKVNGVVFAVAAASWVGSFILSRDFLPFFTRTPGIDIVFIPSGVRLIVLMAGGIWAALGVSAGSLFLAAREFQIESVGSVLVIAAGSGLFPYLALLASLRATGVDMRFEQLTPLKLPLISLGVAIGSSLLHNMLFCLLGTKPWGSFAANVTTMAMGDFAGTLLAVAIVFVALRIFRGRPG